ncbi:MAG: CHAP domain-containing protein, partial [Methylococcales bacterium]|nr:CHAP domain-containing protein [Methylococcales bacterium]
SFSNCQAKCVIFEPHHENGTYTGIKWQCVEFARRWLLKRKGVVYGDVDVAADIWDKISHFKRISDGHLLPTINYEIGSTAPPQVGDLLVYAKAYKGTGHVAVVLSVDANKQVLQVGEQNYLNTEWPSTHARKIHWLKRGGRYWLLDPYLLGWKRSLALCDHCDNPGSKFITKLPKEGKQVSLADIGILTQAYGLHDLWQKIKKDPPKNPFRSDGCSMWFNDWGKVSIYSACFFHDLKYWSGYPDEELERLKADSELMMDVAKLLKSTKMAEAMFNGVRLGGHERYKRSFSWGFGRE